MNIEVCINSVDGAIAAEKFDAKRVELCTALSVGGLTPSFGLIQQCVEASTVEVHVIIRPREGDFTYNLQEIALMKIDISEAKRAGATGVVFGVLTANNTISDLNKVLVDFAKSLHLEVTFHRAFDFISDYKVGIQKIIDFGFDRLLTSGTKPTAIEGLQVIDFLQKDFGNNIQIMAGSGVNSENALQLAATGIKNLHFTALKSINSNSKLSMGEFKVVDEVKIKNIVELFQ
ncbi:copper homeostasis protein CutC [Lutibacter sp. A80]|uniref:copper homeostasis protein CutC n=1 Tax=Lutibacter sp. A80 TaxID=2918453 RepID=UPI001F052CD4|nr:copper homeostasis protein CutC [Lutibacter sp. A80]UMB61112.1 copper homeostasis protein CutC [Lutibacter sp. A80]